MFYKKLTFLVTFFISLINISLINNKAHSILIPRALGNESRIKIINYMPNSVIKFVGHYGYGSIIEFGPDEEITTVIMGNQTAWQLSPKGNRIFIKPIDEDASTNMTVITNKRTYFFEVHADKAEDVTDRKLSFIIKFVYPENQNNNNNIAHSNNFILPDLKKPELYNFNYTIAGLSKNIEPILIFDDGEFTYFKFPSLNTELPAIFLVDRENNEALINYRVYG